MSTPAIPSADHAPHAPRRTAFSLVEVLLAIGILTASIVVLIGLLGNSFAQVESVVQTNRAINVIQAVNAALDSPEGVAGDRLINPGSGKSRFSEIYDFVKGTTNKKAVLFYCTMAVKNNKNEQRDTTINHASVVYYSGNGNFTMSEYNQQNCVGPVFRIELSVSPLLNGNRIVFDTAKGRPSDSVYEGGPIPNSADGYALAWVPLYAEVYAHPMGADIPADQLPPQRPVYATEIIINR